MPNSEAVKGETLLVPEMRRLDALNKLALALCETLTPEEEESNALRLRRTTGFGLGQHRATAH